MKIAAFLPELLRHLFKKPATVDYPFKKLAVPKDFRGTLILKPELCITCKACVRDCPAEAIDLSQLEGADKKWRMIIHNDRCIHCAQCVDSCPTDALYMNLEFETAAYSRHDLKMQWEYLKAVVKPKAQPAAPKPPVSGTPSTPAAPSAPETPPAPENPPAAN